MRLKALKRRLINLQISVDWPKCTNLRTTAMGACSVYVELCACAGPMQVCKYKKLHDLIAFASLNADTGTGKCTL